VFLNYRDSVERVNGFLREQGFVTSAFHGGLDQQQREAALYRFSNGSATVLVATDLASRGLDIPHIDNIIHYHLPHDGEALVHRVGRTARWDQLGRTFFLVGPEESIEQLDLKTENFECTPSSTSKAPQPRMTTVYIGKGKKDKVSKGDIVGFLCKVGGLKAGEIGRIDVMDRYAYAAIARPRLQMVLRNVQGGKIKGVRTIVEPVR
jgi:superfamily II DNA/RNA helicase